MDLSRFKVDTFNEAESFGLDVKRHHETLGRLVPVGSWILDNISLIDELTVWRDCSKKMFLTRFEPSRDGTTQYLEQTAIAEPNRILFMIEANSVFVGHIGLILGTDQTAELDNLIRGKKGGDRDLAELSEARLLEWAFFDLGLERIELRVLSFNFQARAMHDSIGFTKFHETPLRAAIRDGKAVLEECEASVSNVPFTSDRMVVTKTDYGLTFASRR